MLEVEGGGGGGVGGVEELRKTAGSSVGFPWISGVCEIELGVRVGVEGALAVVETEGVEMEGKNSIVGVVMSGVEGGEGGEVLGVEEV